MAKHRRTTEKGRHRKPSASVRPGLMAAATGGVLYAALSVSGASAAELTDEQSVSAEESGGYAEDSYSSDSYRAATGTYADESGVDGQALSDETQPGGEEQPRAGLEVDEASQLSPGAQAEPGMGSAEPSVSLVNEVDGVPVLQILEDDGAQPEAEAGSGQPPTDEQPQPIDGQQSSMDEQSRTDTQQPGADQEPSADDQGIAAGDIIRQELVDNKAGVCSAGVAATDGENNFLITAGHCNSGLSSKGEEHSELNGTDPGWFTEDGQPIGHTERREFPGADFSVVRSGTDLNPEDFNEVGEAYVGEDVCQRGAVTFRETGVRDNCGKVTAVDDSYTFTNKDEEGNPSYDTVNDLINTDITSLDGDSGGLLYDKNTKQALGLLSGQGRFYPLSEVMEQTPSLRLGVAPKSAS